MKSSVRISAEALASLVAISLSACGGGGSGSPAAASTSTGSPAPAPAPTPAPAPAPTASAEGLYFGTSSNSRYISGFVLSDGTYWVLYSSPNNSNIIAGAVQGTGTSTNGTFSSTNARDFNLEGQGINNATVSASYVARQNFNGTITYSGSNQVVTLATTYSLAYDQTPSLATLAGNYFGTAAVVAGTESATLTISSAGLLSGRGTSGCTFRGTAVPRASGNVYDLSVTFGGGVCANGSSTVTGIGFLDTITNRLYGTALNSDRSNGFIFVGIRS